MDWSNYIAFLILFFLISSCGQVGTITGGDIDQTAPRVVVHKVNPPNESTNINPNKITIPFDEFIALNKPAENIRVTPEDVKLNYSIKKKSLVLTKEEGEWMPNTTYTIYLNRAVKDITEENDSIMSYVFSTGSYIDSLQTAVQIQDALKGNTLSGITVGLYVQKLIDDTSKVDARYLSLTDDSGIARFNHLKEGEYFVYAFEDENRNNRLDATEKRATLKKSISLFAPDTVLAVGPVLQLMPPEITKLEITSNDVVAGAGWAIGFNRKLSDDELFVVISEHHSLKFNENRDSLTVFFENYGKSGEHVALLKTENSTDTIKKKYFYRTTPNLKVSNNLKQKKLGVNDTLTFSLSEPIQFIDSSHFFATEIQKNDTLEQNLNYSIRQTSNQEFQVVFKKQNQDKIFINIAPSGFSGINYALKDTLKLDFSLQQEKETGTMIVEFDTIPPYGVLFITHQNTKEEIAVVFDGQEKQSHEIRFLEPGQYTFHYLIDENKDGTWTTGNVFTHQKPEKMIWFPAVSTIRANWDVKTNLMLTDP
ncbi:MAG: Ig-like domain-containing protein [Brumimicrobium sp.]